MSTTLKKEITRLVNAKSGGLRINNFCTLERWTKSGTGLDVDKLEIRFDALNDICIKGGAMEEIKSRDYNGIIEECNNAIQKFFEEAYRQTTNDLNAGYWMGSDKESWVSIES